MCHMNTKTPVAICMAQAAFARERAQAQLTSSFFVLVVAPECARLPYDTSTSSPLLLSCVLGTAVHCYCVASGERVVSCSARGKDNYNYNTDHNYTQYYNHKYNTPSCPTDSHNSDYR